MYVFLFLKLKNRWMLTYFSQYESNTGLLITTRSIAKRLRKKQNMALAKELMGFSSFVSASYKAFLHNKHGSFWVNTILLPSHNTRVVRLRKGANFPMAAISEDLIKTTLTVHAEKPVQFKVRAVVIVRNKIK